MPSVLLVGATGLLGREFNLLQSLIRFMIADK
jgi:hypothetical protein